MNAPTFGTIEAARMAGVTVRQLQYWAARGYLQPVREITSDERGARWVWSGRDVDAAARFGALSNALGLGQSARLFARLAAVIGDAPYEQTVALVLDVGRFTVRVEVTENIDDEVSA